MTGHSHTWDFAFPSPFEADVLAYVCLCGELRTVRLDAGVAW